MTAADPFAAVGGDTPTPLPSCQDPSCPDYGDPGFGEGTCPEDHAVPTVVSQYTVCALPADDPNHWDFAITVDRAYGTDNTDLWACRRKGRCLNTAGQWEWEPQPSSRTDAWLADHRHTLDAALRLAREAAPLVKLNGFTAAQVLAHAEAKGAGR